MARRFAVAVVVVVLAIGVGAMADRTRKVHDLTSDKALSLTDETEGIVRRFHRSVRITAVMARNQPGRAEASALLSRYRRLNSNVKVRLIDPDERPGEVRRLGVDALFGGVAVAYGKRVETGTTASEQDITAAMARALRGGGATVCFTTGHGERDFTAPVEDSLSQGADLLRRNGYKVLPAELLTATAMPDGCRAIVIAAPTAPLGPAEDVIARYLAGGGNALVLTDPESTVDLTPLLEPYDIGIERGIVYEGDKDARLPDDPITPAIVRYRSTSPVVRNLPPTVFPGAQAVTVGKDATNRGLSVAGVARTSDLSYLERDPKPEGTFDPGTDLQGPITIAATADQSGNFGGKVRRTRLAVFGDADFASNAFLSTVGNSRLFVQAMDWLTLDEDLVSVSANLPSLRPLELTESRTTYARLLSSAIVPAFFLLAGAMVWAIRRPR